MMNVVDWDEAARRLRAGEVGVVPTDTIYGLLGSALQVAVVERIYALRLREVDKPLIVLIGSVSQLQQIGISADSRVQELFKRVWPGSVSLVMKLENAELAYLHRGTNSLAVRWPQRADVRRLLEQTGPLVAPSANLAGHPSANTMQEAWKYFGNEVFYVDGGKLEHSASALVDVRTNDLKVLRPAPGFDGQLLTQTEG
jgi:L-threonylcarbamoyladenylate synthase